MTSGVRQRGVAAVVFLAIFAMILIGVLTTAFSSRSAQIDYDAKTFPVLAAAKEALIAYAVANPDAPGRLPCVYLNNVNEGISDSPCPAGPPQLGRLPWKTLGTQVLRDGSGECLWYAVSSNFAQTVSPGTPPINSEQLGQLTVRRDASTTMATNVIAVIFAPGPTLDGNDRTVGTPTQCGGNANANAYLDSISGNSNAAVGATTTVYAGLPSATFNDRLVYITAADLLPRVERRVAAQIGKVLERYYAVNGYLPFASSSLSSSASCAAGTYQGLVPQSPSTCGLAPWPATGIGAIPAWFLSEQWDRLTYYAVATPCTDPVDVANCNGGSGLLTLLNGTAPVNTKKALIFEAGAALAGQSRPALSVTDLLEGSENTDLNSVYVVPVRSATVNDVVVEVGP